ncbi:MAG: Coenzyme F420 hydrogenase/dehydrogenase, beta subunit C-terminal domain [Candidatus Methanomethylophilaceae archaeon]|nr:Coenzyme F420 hydrogenase/dehydrogenase, beta subunit C-terminal domain [Candidatus Methanomethylophilaceae archaeon]
MDVRLELPLLKCTGCSACESVCPKGAISMDINSQGFGKGFRYPHVDASKCIECGKCVKTCPVLNPSYSGDKKPKVYSVKCPSHQMKCASGGVFGFLADRFLSEGGGVCGAAFDEGFELRERYVEDPEGLPPLLSSKYLQSYPGDVYSEIEKSLKAGKKVLFCSTPCQVAGLKAYLKKAPGNLYCVDLLCRGVPSNELFKRYLHETFNGDIENVGFRSKSVGWTTSMTISRPNGKEEVYSRKDDPYIRLFESWASLRESCYECPFNRIPRQGDLTIGDHWGVGAENRNRKGISIVLVNSKKGKELLDMIEKGGNSVIETDIESASARNRAMTKPTAKPKAYAKLQAGLESLSVSDALWYAGLVKKDVCMVLMSNRNFGNNLTNWSLYRTIKSMGYSVVMTSRNRTHRISPLFQKNPYRPDESFVLDPYRLNDLCKVFLVGCDQTFAPMGISKERVTLLPWVRGDRYKMSYSASLGKSVYEDATEDQIKQFAYLFKRFNAVSVREASGPGLMRETFGVDAECVMDPVFLSTADDYRSLAATSRIKAPREKYVHCYLLDPTPDKVAEVKRYAKRMGIKKITCIVNKGERTPIEGFEVHRARVESFIELLDKSSLFVTDSFHGLCMAMILNKNFYALKVKKIRGEERFRSILGLVGLEDRWASVAEPRFDDIDYGPVNSILGKEVERSKAWLKEHLEQGMAFDGPLDAYDMQLVNADRVMSFQSASFRQASFAMNADCRSSEVFDPSVCASIGNSYHAGRSVPKDDSKAIEWLKRACMSGDVPSMVALRRILRGRDDEESRRDLLSTTR